MRVTIFTTKGSAHSYGLAIEPSPPGIKACAQSPNSRIVRRRVRREILARIQAMDDV